MAKAGDSFQMPDGSAYIVRQPAAETAGEYIEMEFAAGGDREVATRALLELRQQGERIPGLLFGLVRKLREAVRIAEALQAGRPPAELRRTLRMPSYVADRLIADVRERDAEGFRRALELLADLELESRGGGAAALSEETMATRAVLAITAAR